MSGTLWNATQQQVAATTYLRSWRVEVFDDYGTDPRIVCHMEKITVDASGNRLGSTPEPTITRNLSQVMTDPNVGAAMTAIQTLIEEWYAADNQTVVTATPDPTLPPVVPPVVATAQTTEPTTPPPTA